MKIRIHKPIYGIPISFLSKYNSDQFHIIGITNGCNGGVPIQLKIIKGSWKCIINGKQLYNRIFIKQK